MLKDKYRIKANLKIIQLLKRACLIRWAREIKLIQIKDISQYKLKKILKLKHKN